MEQTGPKFENRDSVRAKEAGIEQRLIFDWHRRGAFLDHFLRDDVDLRAVYRAFYGEQGDFVNLPYQAEVKGGADELAVTLRRDGQVWAGSQQVPMRVTKIFTFRRGEEAFRCVYGVRNLSGAAVDVRFAVELASGFDGGQVLEHCHLTVNGGAERYSLADLREYPGVSEHTSITNLRGLALTTGVDQPCALWTFPLETVTMSEAGYERGYQGTVYLHVWPLHLEPGAEWTGTITQRVSAHEKTGG
jgi:alpha-amylase